MKFKNVYISAPISMDWSTVSKYKMELEVRGLNVYLWDRTSKYSQSDFDNCRSVVFLLPKNKFKASHSDLPVGLQRELSCAYAQDKDIYIGYQTSNGDYNFYEADTNGVKIEGISRTSGSIFNRVFVNRSAEKVVINSQYGIDTEHELMEIANEMFNSNPCEELIQKVTKVYSRTQSNSDYIDERLLLML